MVVILRPGIAVPFLPGEHAKQHATDDDSNGTNSEEDHGIGHGGLPVVLEVGGSEFEVGEVRIEAESM